MSYLQHSVKSDSIRLNGKPLNLRTELRNRISESAIDPDLPESQAEEEAKVERKFQPWSMADLLAMPPKVWIIDQVIGAGDLAMVYGAPGCGKTFVVIDLIFAACIGKQFAKRFGVDRPLNVAYAAGEGISGLPMRFAAAAASYSVTHLPNFTFFSNTPQLYADNNAYANVRDFVYEWKERELVGDTEPLDILIIDTLHSATTGADENSSQHMGVVLTAAKQAAQELGCAVILVHHTNKSGSAERGSSALRGAMDCMIEIRRVSDAGTKAVMHCAKLKDGEAWKDQTFDLVASTESVRVWWDEPGEISNTKNQDDECKRLMRSFMANQPSIKLTAKTLAEVAGIYQMKATRLLSKMVSDGQCKSELMHSDQPNSNRNPVTYFIA